MIIVVEDRPDVTGGLYPAGFPVATSVRPMTLVEHMIYRLKKLSAKNKEYVIMEPGTHRRSIGIQITEGAWAFITGACRTACSASYESLFKEEPALMELIAPARTDTTPFDNGDMTV